MRRIWIEEHRIAWRLVNNSYSDEGESWTVNDVKRSYEHTCKVFMGICICVGGKVSRTSNRRMKIWVWVAYPKLSLIWLTAKICVDEHEIRYWIKMGGKCTCTYILYLCRESSLFFADILRIQISTTCCSYLSLWSVNYNNDVFMLSWCVVMLLYIIMCLDLLITHILLLINKKMMDDFTWNILMLSTE